jgi:hypothetical protein
MILGENRRGFITYLLSSDSLPRARDDGRAAPTHELAAPTSSKPRQAFASYEAATDGGAARLADAPQQLGGQPGSRLATRFRRLRPPSQGTGAMSTDMAEET